MKIVCSAVVCDVLKTVVTLATGKNAVGVAAQNNTETRRFFFTMDFETVLSLCGEEKRIGNFVH